MTDIKDIEKESYTSTTNACKLCTPLGACIAFKGVSGAVSLMHGSQGCATYIRRYLISHFREPVDIASSNFTEDTAIFGGGANLKTAVKNVADQYKPEIIGITTTCLSETIGDDVELILKSMEKNGPELPCKTIHVSTPSYQGTHESGFRQALKSLVAQLATEKTEESEVVNVISAMLSPADIRHLKEILSDMGISSNLLPDYSETLDGGLWSEYIKIPEGGTGISEIESMADSVGTVELGHVLDENSSASVLLERKHQVPGHILGIPIGVEATDRFLKTLMDLTGKKVPEEYVKERGRLLDSYVDGHKYIFGKKCVLYGEEDFVAAMALFLCEIGIIPSVCASGGKTYKLKKAIYENVPEEMKDKIHVLEGVDFFEIEYAAKAADPDFFIGNSKGYSITRKLNIPLIRAGFPIHDRFGGGRVLHVGYRGTQMLFDTIVNTLLTEKQDRSKTGYSYL